MVNLDAASYANPPWDTRSLILDIETPKRDDSSSLVHLFFVFA